MAEMKDSFKNTFTLDVKSAFNVKSLEKIYKKWFVLARASVSTTRIEAFIEKYASTIGRNCFFRQENQRNWFPIAGKCFSFLSICSP